MSDQVIGEIRLFAGNFAPRDWAFCNGQLLAIATNTALYSVIGTTYGGDGKTNFALPDLRGRAPMQQGSGPGLTPRMLGQPGGSATVSLTGAQMPPHTHAARAVSANGASGQDAQSAVWASGWTQRGPVVTPAPTYTTAGTTPMQPLAASGGDQPHNNMQPYLGLSFIIALVGMYPLRP